MILIYLFLFNSLFFFSLCLRFCLILKWILFYTLDIVNRVVINIKFLVYRFLSFENVTRNRTVGSCDSFILWFCGIWIILSIGSILIFNPASSIEEFSFLFILSNIWYFICFKFRHCSFSEMISCWDFALHATDAVKLNILSIFFLVIDMSWIIPVTFLTLRLFVSWCQYFEFIQHGLNWRSYIYI